MGLSWHPGRRLSLLLAAAMLLPLAASATVAPGLAAPTMRDMAACCARRKGHCPMAPASKPCCEQRVGAPQLPALLASAPVLAAAPALAPGTASELAPALVSPAPTGSAASVPHSPPRLSTVLQI